ncbi:MAG: hypothetical protein WBF58_05805 [Xanthobacteraceae bacterium]
MTQLAMQHVVAQRVFARHAIHRRSCRRGQPKTPTVSGSAAGAAQRFTWLQIAGAGLKRVFAAFVWFWNTPVVEAEEAQESHYLRTGRFN